MKTLFLITAMLMATPSFAELDNPIRVEIIRETPSERQFIVQEFADEDLFAMWMGGKLEGEGCDPYVTEVKILRNWSPKAQQ